MITPSPSPSPLPSTLTETLIPHSATSSSPPSKLPIDFSPPLIAMVVVVAAAFVVVTYSRLISRHVIVLHRRYRRYHRRRRLLRSLLPSPDPESGPSDDFYDPLSPYGLDDSVIKSIPLSLYTKKSGNGTVMHDCAVCLFEFEDRDCIRTLPSCYHMFHVDCIDIWLRSHANCPLCRAGIVCSPFVPVMSPRIRPSLDDMIIETGVMEPLVELPEVPVQPPATEDTCEITQESEDHFERRDFLLKRSYSFSFERNLGSERLVFEPATTSPWRYRRGGGFWNKKPSPFGSLAKPRVFSFRYYRGMKSPFFRRRGGFFPLSERCPNGGSSRRSKSMASPMFMRSAGPSVGPFSSSRLRSGDPEALLSPERFNRR